MKEKKKQAENQLGGGGGGDSIFDSAADIPESKDVSVASGPYQETLPIAGMTVGEARHKFSDRFDIDDQAQAIVDGHQVGDDVLLKAGESLMFIRHAGEKGANGVMLAEKTAVACSNGAQATMSIEKLVGRLGGDRLSSGSSIIPAGVKSIVSRGNMTLWFWEKAPHICQFNWITSDSPRPYGPGTKYRKVRIALPYLVIMSAFIRQPDGMPQLALKDECFFRTDPLKSISDGLLYPGLLNCSVMGPVDGKHNNPLAWICTQYLKQTKQMSSKDPGERFCAGLEAVRYCLLETGFNLSSEHHEGNSWYGKSKTIDPRISTIEKWEENTKKDPLFVLDVPWIKTGFTLAGVADRTFKNLCAADDTVRTADDISRIVFNG